MKKILLILFALFIPGGLIFSMEADTVWKTELDTWVVDYKYSPDDSKILVNRGSAYEMLLSETGESIWSLPTDAARGFFFLPNDPDKFIAIKNLKEYYYIDAITGTPIDTLIVENAVDSIPLDSEISFDGKYLVATYLYSVTHMDFYNRVQIIDLEKESVHFRGFDFKFDRTALNQFELGEYDNRLLWLRNEEQFNGDIKTVLYENWITPEGLDVKNRPLIWCNDCGYPGIIDIEFLNNENSIGVFDDNGDLFKINLDNYKKTELYSPFIGGSKFSFSKDNKFIVTTSDPNVIIDLTLNKYYEIIETLSFGYYNLKFYKNTFKISSHRDEVMYMIDYGFITSTESEDNIEIIYPNPTSTDVTINFESSYPAFFSFRITDINSQLVKEKNIGLLNAGYNTISIDISELASQPYFITIFSKSESFNFKVIKE